MKTNIRDKMMNQDKVYNDLTFVDVTDDFMVTLENLVVRYNELNNDKDRRFDNKENYDNYLINYAIKMIEYVIIILVYIVKYTLMT